MLTLHCACRPTRRSPARRTASLPADAARRAAPEAAGDGATPLNFPFMFASRRSQVLPTVLHSASMPRLGAVPVPALQSLHGLGSLQTARPWLCCSCVAELPHATSQCRAGGTVRSRQPMTRSLLCSPLSGLRAGGVLCTTTCSSCTYTQAPHM